MGRFGLFLPLSAAPGSCRESGVERTKPLRRLERKFLVAGKGWRNPATDSRSFRQGYLAETDNPVIRARTVDEAKALPKFKSAVPGATGGEFEYPVLLADAMALIESH